MALWSRWSETRRGLTGLKMLVDLKREHPHGLSVGIDGPGGIGIEGEGKYNLQTGTVSSDVSTTPQAGDWSRHLGPVKAYGNINDDKSWLSNLAETYKSWLHSAFFHWTHPNE